MTDLIEQPVKRPPGRPRKDPVVAAIPIIVKEMMNGRPCWEKLNGERMKAFAAFQFFRDQGPSRTIVDTARMLNNALNAKFEQQEIAENIERGDKAYKRVRLRKGSPRAQKSAENQINAWAREYGWWDRVDFYDRHLDKVRVEEAEKEVKAMTQRHIAIAGLIQNKATAKLRELEHSNLSPDQALKYLVEGTKLERMSRGEATDISEAKNKAGQSNPANDVRTEGVDPRDELKRRIDAIASKKRQAAEETAKKEEQRKEEAREAAKKERNQNKPVEVGGLHLVRSADGEESIAVNQ